MHPSALALVAIVMAQTPPDTAPAPGATPPVAEAAAPEAPAPEAPPLAGVPFAPGEQLDLDIDYLHVRTASARMVLGKPEGAVWPVICLARTDGVATMLDIREHFVSYWDAEAHVPRGSDLNAIEIGDRHTDRARFDRENGKATVQVIRKGRSRESTHDVPHDVQDIASALLYLRLRPLAPGDHLEFPVFSGTDTFVLQADVEDREAIETPAGRFDTVRVRVLLGFKDKFRSRNAHVWISTDPRRIPVRASADFAVGSVTATLSAYRPGGQVARR